MPVIACPKCGAPMRTRRRNGVTIEQCVDCHGIFLDRGELEQLIGAEASFLSVDPPETDVYSSKPPRIRSVSGSATPR